MIAWLNPLTKPQFPSTEHALDSEELNGLLAAGGALNATWLKEAYHQGIFPWFAENEEILWWSPAPRMCILPETLHIPKTVKKHLRKTAHKISINQDFAAVIQACAEPRDYANDTWISPAMINAYCELHQQGLAVSAEMFADTQLVGGLYGVLLGQVFFGESMFSRQSNASKLVFAAFAQHLFAQGVKLIDCQMHTAHLAQFGGVMLERKEFEGYLPFTQQIRPQLGSRLNIP